jgi:c-di-AMP phosphodiesterase-like protein
MNIKLAVIAVLIIAALSITACGSSTPAKPKTLNGTWTTVDKNEDGTFTAVINKDRIAVVLGDDDSSSIYWVGSFPKMTSDKVVSEGNTEVMDASIFGSGDKTKVFSYKGGQLAFKFTMMGTTTTVHLKKK